jgi:hypothetical protein
MNKNLLLVLLASMSILISCSETITDEPLANEAPNTFLFIDVPDGTDLNQQKSRLKVHWWGDDADGLVVGYFFRWEGLDDEWNFTYKNDSTFSLPIGTVDTNFTFTIHAVDNDGNGKYDNEVFQNGVSYGPEPFIDANTDGVYNDGETYFDLGLVDPIGASQSFPIKNSAPEIEWSEASLLPAESLPVITVGWGVDDLDGVESIVQINLALNDTSTFVELERSVSLITLRSNNFDTAEPTFQILVNGSESDILTDELQNLRLNDNNRLYVQAVDISGASSPFVALPDTSSDWFVKKPKGKFLVVDDFGGGASFSDFYTQAFNEIGSGSLIDKYDVLDVEGTELPFPNITFLETLKLYDYIYWYSDSDPSLDLLTISTQNYVESGGKIMFSLTFQDSSSTFDYEFATLQNFLPVESYEQEKAINFVFPGANIISTPQAAGYPNLSTASTIAFVHTFVPSNVATPIYNLSSSQVNGNIAVMNGSKSLFFIGLPLHQCDANEGTVKLLFEKVIFEEFGLTP